LLPKRKNREVGSPDPLSRRMAVLARGASRGVGVSPTGIIAEEEEV